MTGRKGAEPAEAPEELEDLDPGLARERTQLAWRRTAISFAAITAAVLKADPVAGLPLAVMTVGVWTVAQRQAARRPGRGTGSGARTRAVRLIALTTGLTALIALAVALLAGGRTSWGA